MMMMNTTMAIVTSTMEVPVSSLKSTVVPFQSLRGYIRLWCVMKAN